MQEVSSPKSAKHRVRPAFPTRAVITAGMPYGNKDHRFEYLPPRVDFFEKPLNQIKEPKESR